MRTKKPKQWASDKRPVPLPAKTAVLQMLLRDDNELKTDARYGAGLREEMENLTESIKFQRSECTKALAGLEAAKLVQQKSTLKRGGRGRPVEIFELTEEGRKLAKSHRKAIAIICQLPQIPPPILEQLLCIQSQIGWEKLGEILTGAEKSVSQNAPSQYVSEVHSDIVRDRLETLTFQDANVLRALVTLKKRDADSKLDQLQIITSIVSSECEARHLIDRLHSHGWIRSTFEISSGNWLGCVVTDLGRRQLAWFDDVTEDQFSASDCGLGDPDKK